jgi:hypothetical protein
MPMTKVILGVVEPGAVEAAVLASEEEGRKQDEVVEALPARSGSRTVRGTARTKAVRCPRIRKTRLVADELGAALGTRHWSESGRLSCASPSTSTVMIGSRPPPARNLRHWRVNWESVWNSPEADMRLKKRIVRTLIQEIVVDVDAEAGELILIIHWKGGACTRNCAYRGEDAVRMVVRLPKDTVDAVKVLARICSDDWIAAALNRSNLRTGRGNYWTKERVGLAADLLRNPLL